MTEEQAEQVDSEKPEMQQGEWKPAAESPGEKKAERRERNTPVLILKYLPTYNEISTTPDGVGLYLPAKWN